MDQLIFKNILPSGHQLVLGALLVAMIVFSPAGLLPLLRTLMSWLKRKLKNRLIRKNHAAT